MIKEWKPTARQEDFLSLPDSIFEALYGGAAGGGKTEALLALPIVKKTKQSNRLYDDPRFKMLYLRRTFPELENEVIPRSYDFYKPAGADWNGSNKRWTFPSRSIIQFGHCEHEKDVTKYDTAEYNIIAWDEATSFTPYQYCYLSFSRCRTSSPDLPAIVRGGTNPGNVGHSFHRKRFVEPNPKGNVILREVRDGQTLLRIFIPSKVQDNPYLIKNDPDYVTRLNKLPEKDRAAKADGDWWAYSGQVFSDFRENHIPGEPEYALHVVEPFPIPDFWAKILAIDWGYSANMVAGWYAINPFISPKHTAKIYKYRELVCVKTKIAEWANHIKTLSTGESLLACTLDPSAWGKTGQNYTIQEQFSESSGINPEKADNDRIGGKLLLQEYLRWDRGRPPKFQIFNTCEETIKVIPMCNYKKDKNKPAQDSNDEGNAEDVEEFRGDDAYDETRYGIKACQRFLDSGKSEHEYRELVAKACSIFEQPNVSPSQLTTFYINMDRLEGKRFSSQRVKKFHGSRLPHANF